VVLWHALGGSAYGASADGEDVLARMVVFYVDDAGNEIG
jgi:hypothetical protein